MKDKFYITTTLPYVNAAPHIGHALEFVQADVISRYQRQKLGQDQVFLNVGTDEHGLKMFTKANEQGITPQEYVDKYAAEWKHFCELFSIEYDNFYRTTDADHKRVAVEFWNRSNQNGDIYSKKYEGLYCVGHESFITEKELVDGKCPDHGTEPVEFAEENYFFRLSKYRDQLLSWLDQNPGLVKPQKRVQELRNWISNMEDISISRIKENLPWGIDVPGDDAQVMYVWFDALTNYVGAIGFPNEEYSEWWPGVQVFGPDNLRFQGAIWQGMLASSGLEHTRELLCHGMVLASDGTKMSKTKGNTVSPFEQQEKFGTDAVRYYLINGISTFNDSPYVEENLINNYNAHLADNYGNLLNRVIHLANNRAVSLNRVEDVSSEFKSKVDALGGQIKSAYDEYELQQATELITELTTYGNKYIDEQQPWSKEVDPEHAAEVLNNLSYLLAAANEAYLPVIPAAAAKAIEALKVQEKIILFPKLEVSEYVSIPR